MNLELIKTEVFNGLDCNFYRGEKGQIMLSREQIGTALEYSEPRIAIEKIHARHQHRMNSLSVVTSLGAADGKRYDTYLYTERGVMEICRWSRQPKANQFMDFVWDVVETFMHQGFSPATTTSDTTLDLIQQNQLLLQQITLLNQVNQQVYTPPKYTRFKRMAFDKLNLLAERANSPLGKVIHDVIAATEDAHGFYLRDYENEYIQRTGIVKPQALDVIEYYPHIRESFTAILNSVATPADSCRHSLHADYNMEEGASI